jgi:hypothetical protein
MSSYVDRQIDLTVTLFSQADFLNFADAVEDYVYNLYATARTLLAGGNAAWPSNSVMIA